MLMKVIPPPTSETLEPGDGSLQSVESEKLPSSLIWLSVYKLAQITAVSPLFHRLMQCGNPNSDSEMLTIKRHL